MGLERSSRLISLLLLPLDHGPLPSSTLVVSIPINNYLHSACQAKIAKGPWYSKRSDDSNESAPATTESVHLGSNLDFNGSESTVAHDPTTTASQNPGDKSRTEPSSSSGSDDEIITPHHSVMLPKPQAYIPARVADIETQVPSFNMPSPGRESIDFPSIVSGPLPALAKAPVAGWSKPFAPKATIPSDRPLDFQPKQFEPHQSRLQGTTTSASRHEISNRWSSAPKDQSDDWNTGSRRSPTTRRPWAERSEPKKRNLGFDTAAYRARYPDKSESPEPEIKRGLEPIYDSNDWEVLTPSTPVRSKVTHQMQSSQLPRATLQAQEQRFKEEYMARLAREREERESITKAMVEADEDDPYGGW